MVTIDHECYGDLMKRIYAASTEREVEALWGEFYAAIMKFAIAAKYAAWLKEAYEHRHEEFGVGP